MDSRRRGAVEGAGGDAALMAMAHSLSESVVVSMASARSLDVHSDKTHRMSGAKRARTSIWFGDGVERSAPS